MTLEAPAKINLGLHILFKRPDGYHEIETVFHRIDWYDRITLRPRKRGISLSCNLPYIPTDDRNLCVRAVKQLFALTRYDGGLHIDLEKHVPVGAGLGGGSSDAATVLKGVNDLYEFHAPDDVLFNIAGHLGSDIPFFLGAKTALATGRGEKLENLALELPYTILVVYPDVHVSTKWAYQNLQPSSYQRENERAPSLKEIWLEGSIDLIRNHVRNDFEPTIFPSFPVIGEAKEMLYSNGAAFALMSGSGSCVFGLFSNRETALACVERLPKTYVSWLVADSG